MLHLEIYSPVRLFAQSLVVALRGYDQFRVNDPARSFDDLLGHLSTRTPDVLLVDVVSSDIVCNIALVSDRWPLLPILAIAVPDDPVEVVACAEAGFSAFLPSGASIERAHDAIHAAARDEMICSGRVATTLMREIHRRPRPAPMPVETCLTARERQIVPLLAEGRSNKEIARELAISVATVKNHVHNILNKLGAGHRRAAVARVQASPALLHGAEPNASERPPPPGSGDLAGQRDKIRSPFAKGAPAR